MKNFREEIEKLVILDYLMRNTDRGLDNFMIKACPGKCSQDSDDKAALAGSQVPYDKPHMHIAAIDNSLSFPHHHPKGWVGSFRSSQLMLTLICCREIIRVRVELLNFQAVHHKCPADGWLWLPVSLIGMPFSEATRSQYLPILSSPMWYVLLFQPAAITEPKLPL